MALTVLGNLCVMHIQVLEIRDSQVHLEKLDVQITDAEGGASSTSTLYSMVLGILVNLVRLHSVHPS